MWEVIGYTKVEGKNKAGEAYTGYRVYLEAVEPRTGTQGREVDVIFYKTNFIDYIPCLHDRIVCERGQYGVQRIMVI